MSANASTPAAPEDCRTLAVALERRVAALWWELLRAADGGLSRTGAAVLAALREEGPLRVTDLATREGVAQPSMTCLINRLERDELVERRPDPLDGRATLVAVTAHGMHVLELRAVLRTERLSTRLEHLSAEERGALQAALGVLDRLVDRPAAVAP